MKRRERERTDFGARLYRARKDAKMSQTELAEKVGMAQGTLGEAEYAAQGSSYTAQLAQATGVRAEWLASGIEPMRDGATAEAQPEYAGTMTPNRRIGIFGTARLAEGDEGYYEEVSSVPGAGDGHIDMATADPDAFGLRVRGGSMAPAIRDGWYVLVEPNARPAVGEYVLLKLRNGQRMVKELLYQRADSIEVLSVNSGQRRTIYAEELEAVQAVAAVVSPSKWKPD